MKKFTPINRLLILFGVSIFLWNCDNPEQDCGILGNPYCKRYCDIP